MLQIQALGTGTVDVLNACQGHQVLFLVLQEKLWTMLEIWKLFLFRLRLSVCGWRVRGHTIRNGSGAVRLTRRPVVFVKLPQLLCFQTHRYRVS